MKVNPAAASGVRRAASGVGGESGYDVWSDKVPGHAVLKMLFEQEFVIQVDPQVG